MKKTPLGWKDALEKETGYPLQYSGMEKSMDSIVHGVAKSQTQLSHFHFQEKSAFHPNKGENWEKEIYL